MTPYVGISGITSAAERDAISSILDEIDPDARFYGPRSVALAVLASKTTLEGRKNRYPLRYPVREDIAGCFAKTPRLRGSPRGALCPDTDPEPTEVGLGDERILQALHVAGDDLSVYHNAVRAAADVNAVDLFQVNTPWPAIGDVRAIRWELKRAGWAGQFILQVGPDALAPLEKRGIYHLDQRAVANLVDRIAPYVDDAEEPAFERILIDVSGGRGVRIGPFFADGVCRLVNVFGADVGFGIAGGLDAEVLGELAQTLSFFSWCSVDAEGKLRDSRDGGGRLDLDKVRAYLVAMMRVRGGAGQ